MSKTDLLSDVQEFVSDAMDSILTRFKAGSKITVLVRTPHMPDRDFMMTSDTISELLLMLKRRQKTIRSPVPTIPGFYWAKWRIADEGDAKTEEYNSYLPLDKWEIVDVFENCADRASPEYLRVHICGVSDGQSLENFFWGDGPLEVPS